MHAGIGLRGPHHAALLAAAPPLAFVEVHSENYFADGGSALAALAAARDRYPVSLHGVGLSLGSAGGVDGRHLERLARLVERVDPVRVSDHAAFGRAPRRPDAATVHANDLLPIAYTEASLALTVANVQRVQEHLRRPILVENVSAYLRWADDAVAEPAFFNDLARRSGCGLLLDVNNLVVNALNRGAASDADAAARARDWIDAIDRGIVGEIHVAGYADAADGLVVDDHGSRVRPHVWQVCAHAVARFGALPTLVEWDTDLPPLDVLIAEARRADALAEQEQ